MLGTLHSTAKLIVPNCGRKCPDSLALRWRAAGGQGLSSESCAASLGASVPYRGYACNAELYEDKAYTAVWSCEQERMFGIISRGHGSNPS